MNKIKRPRIKDLQDFANSYFIRQPPVIRWKKMKCCGMAILNKNIIYLNPDMPLVSSYYISVANDSLLYKSKKYLKLSEGEQYFLTLLHEIGHFKMKLKPPREYILIRNKLRKEFPNNLKMQDYMAEDYIEPKKNEIEAEYLGRLEGFRTWLVGDYNEEHNAVEDWSREEFKKQRKTIKRILRLSLANKPGNSPNNKGDGKKK